MTTMINELQQDVFNEYFEWLYHIVCSSEYYDVVSYRELLLYLLDKEFIYYYDMDKNRAMDGISLRYRFGQEIGCNRDLIQDTLDTRPCSVLEMMVALALDIEEQIMSDPIFGDRTAQWFWSMMVSLGISNQTDDKFNESVVGKKVTKFMTHQYLRNGKGGLFTIHSDDYDMTSHEIWDQALRYINEFIGN